MGKADNENIKRPQISVVNKRNLPDAKGKMIKNKEDIPVSIVNRRRDSNNRFDSNEKKEAKKSPINKKKRDTQSEKKIHLITTITVILIMSVITSICYFFYSKSINSYSDTDEWFRKKEIFLNCLKDATDDKSIKEEIDIQLIFTRGMTSKSDDLLYNQEQKIIEKIEAKNNLDLKDCLAKR